MKNHGIKPKVEKRGQQFLGRYKSRRPSSLPTDFRSFVGADRKSVSVPPALKNDLVVDSPSGQGLTHTHTHVADIGAHVGKFRLAPVFRRKRRRSVESCPFWT